MAHTNFGTTVVLTYPLDGTDVSPNPTTKIPATAVQPGYTIDCNFGLKVGDAPISVEYPVHYANGVETVNGFHCGMVDTGTAASSTFDLLVNGLSILAAPVTVANTDPDRTKKNGSIASPTLADGDMVSMKIVMTTNTGAKGPLAQIAIIAAASPT